MTHALLSPSSAHRWLKCPASVWMSRGEPDRSSYAAIEGTAAHEYVLGGIAAGLKASLSDIGSVLSVGGTEVKVDISMVRAAEDVEQFISGCIEDIELRGGSAKTLIERPLALTPITGEINAEGTADVLIIGTFKSSTELHILDFKYGIGVEVEAVDNPQILIYGAAALEEISLIETPNLISLSILQPRVNHRASTWIQSPDSIREKVVSFIRPRSRSILNGVEDESIYLEFNPGVEQCRFCPAGAVCGALSSYVLESVRGVDMSDVNKLTEDQLSELYPKLELMEIWISAVKKRTMYNLASGKPIKGLKLVAGRKGRRVWSNEAEVAEVLSDALKPDEIYEKTLISPAKLEERLTRKSKFWGKISEYIEYRDPIPVIVSDKDERPEFVRETINDFSVL